MDDCQARMAAARELFNRGGAVMVLAGAGMSVDCGLPDFRGKDGLWTKADEGGVSYGNLGKSTLHRFYSDPDSSWAFYRARIREAAAVRPHAGYELLRSRLADRPHFVVTTNVDDMFRRACFAADNICELHGSYFWTQCGHMCSMDVEPLPAGAEQDGPLPVCRRCEGVMRPNVLMFGDRGFSRERLDEQRQRLDAFVGANGGEDLLLIEIGAGTAIPTLNGLGCEYLNRRLAGWRLRINLEEQTSHPRSSELIGPARDVLVDLLGG